MKVTGVLHMHSTHSYDGKVPLVELKKLLIKNGISFCCVTEHTDALSPEQAGAFVAECAQLSDQTFLFVPGFEVPYQNAHVLHIGSTTFHGQFADAQMLLRYRETSAFVVLAHPVRNHYQVDDVLLSVLDGVEVWNQQYEGKQAPRFRSLRLYKKLKLQKPNLVATGGLDFHRLEHYGEPRIEMQIDVLTVETVLHKLQQGLFSIAGNQTSLNSDGTLIKGGRVQTKIVSCISIVLIVVGKAVNATLARFGVRLPTWLRALVRARV